MLVREWVSSVQFSVSLHPSVNPSQLHGCTHLHGRLHACILCEHNSTAQQDGCAVCVGECYQNPPTKLSGVGCICSSLFLLLVGQEPDGSGSTVNKKENKFQLFLFSFSLFTALPFFSSFCLHEFTRQAGCSFIFPTMSPPPKIAIIGAGLTGLLTAHGLRKRGFQVAVFDRESGLDARSRDWTIVLHWALPTFKKLLPEDIVSRLDSAICNPHLEFTEDVECLPCANGKTGELIFKSPMPGSRRISRQRLRKLIAEGVDVQWGKKLEGMVSDEEGVTLKFEDGTAVGADYVLGTDGAASKLRELLFHGEEEKAKVVPSGYYFATCIIKHNDAEKVEAVVKSHPVATVLMGTESVGGIGGKFLSLSLSLLSVSTIIDNA